MALTIPRTQLEEMKTHAVSTYPHECCGIMAGNTGEVKQVTKLYRATNTRTDASHNRYLIDPKEYLRIEQTIQSEGLTLLGIYHSHPDHPAKPSQFDQDHAWPWFSYVILRVTKEGVELTTSWVLKDDRSAFDQEPLREV